MTRTCIGEARAEGLIATLPPSFLHSSSITTCCHVPYYPYTVSREPPSFRALGHRPVETPYQASTAVPSRITTAEGYDNFIAFRYFYRGANRRARHIVMW